MENKKEIRKQMKHYRSQIQDSMKRKMDKVIWQKVFSIPEVKDSQNFFVYASFGTEIDTFSFMQELWQQGKKVYVPKVEEKEMAFYPVSSIEGMEQGYMGILEPKDLSQKASGLQGVMIMPGLAFDKEGHRIGYGGGFYDRYLSQQENELFCIAVAYGGQIFEHLETEAFDYQAHCIVTEREIIRQNT